MAYDIERPYGELIETTVRVATWNVWWRHADWRRREERIVAVLGEHEPDVVVLTEAWDGQAERLGERAGLPYVAFRGDEVDQAPASGIAVLARWPVGEVSARRLGDERGWDAGRLMDAVVEGPRGAIRVFGVMLAWKPGHSGRRQRQVRELAAAVRERTHPAGPPVVVCGDFNAGPDSDEVRMLTGRAEVAAPGVVFYDAWELAGEGDGHTWDNANPQAAPVLWPDRRIDYILSAWPRPGGAGHPVRCELIGTREPPSDHYGVLADLRY